MAHTAAALADGELPATLGGLYTVPTGSRLYLHKITLYSKANAQTVLIAVKRGGSTRRLRRYVLNENESAELPDGGLAVILNDSDMIVGQASASGQVDFTISGVLVT